MTTLASHPKIECFRELFLAENFNPGSYSTFRVASLKNRMRHIFQRRGMVDDFLNGLYQAYPKAESVGFKIMYSQVELLPEVMQWALGHDVKVIHLIRENVLKKRVSRVVQRKRNLAHSEVKVAPMKVVLPVDRLEYKLRQIADLVGVYRERYQGANYLETTYEDLVAYPSNERARILEFLEVENESTLSSDLVKLNPDDLSKVIENYDEVVGALAGTEFERFL